MQTRVKWLLLAGFIVIGLLHLASATIELWYPSSPLAWLTFWFDLDKEYNIPSYYNGIILAFCALTAAGLFMGNTPEKHNPWWFGLNILFLYLSLDEMTLIHEQAAEPLRKMLAITNESIFFHAWVIPALALLLLFGVFLGWLQWKRRNDKHIPIRIITYVFIFAAGAIALEIIGTRTFGNQVVYRLLAVFAEEMYELGMANFMLYQLLVGYLMRPPASKVVN